MRCMRRNTQRFFYALYEDREFVKDEYGNVTGEYTIIRGKPIESRANISAAAGEATMRQFGENVEYDKVMVMGANAPNIDEYSVLWVDTVPQLDSEGNLLKDSKGKIVTPHDYIVQKVAKSLNGVSFAIRKVKVS